MDDDELPSWNSGPIKSGHRSPLGRIVQDYIRRNRSAAHRSAGVQGPEPMDLFMRVIRGMIVPERWAQDQLVRKLFKNASSLFAGNLVASALALVSLGLTARALGPDDFGILVLIAAYVLIVDNLLNFQSWLAVIKYGAGALEDKKKEDLETLLKFGILLDCSTAIGAAVVAVSAVWFIGQWRGWDEQAIFMSMVYSMTILFHIAGTSIGVLRLFNRFHLLAWHTVASAALKVLGVSVAYLTGAGIWMFLLVWAFVDVVGKLLLVLLAYRELRRRNLQGFLSRDLHNVSGKFSGIWRFVWTTNVHSSTKLALTEVDILVIGGLLGPAGAGLYKVVKSIGGILGKCSRPLHQAIYPELARLTCRKDYVTLVHLITRPMRILFALAVVLISVFALVGEPLLVSALGAEFAPAFRPALIFLIGSTIAMLSFPFHPTLLAMGRPQLSLSILIFTSIVYVIALYSLTIMFGLMGSSTSYVVFYVSWSLLMIATITVLIRRELLVTK